MLQESILRRIAWLGVSGYALCVSTAAMGQAVEVAEEEIVVTATKQARDSNVQDAPFAITAFSGEQLDVLNFQSLESLTVAIPNVQFDDAGAIPGTANFSIRGQGIASSTPSLDPTVGVFVDGVYLGVTTGVLLDNFDLEAVEVLRGPQGVLFGRNVTGGAVLLRTRAPTGTFEARGHLSAETGLRVRADGSVSGPIAGDMLSAKLAAYYSHDEGWFRNRFDDSEQGEEETFIVRPAIRLRPSSAVDMILRLEHGETNGDGPAVQNNATKQSPFFIIMDNRGSAENDWQQAILQTDVRVPVGDGRITGIVGWRQLDQLIATDIDGTGSPSFNLQTFTEQDQISGELRYAGAFGSVSLTTGIYYFQQDLRYLERRVLLGGLINSTGGGIGDFSTFGVFASGEYALTDTFSLEAGIRYTRESKDAQVAAILPGRSNFVTRNLIFDFVDTQTWDDFTPRLGFQWEPTPATNLYGYWARGFRSGGYNFRVTDPGILPGPTNPENQSSFEVGLKQDFANRAGRVNVALFHNSISDLQRDITTIGTLAAAQETRNAGDATIYGFEVEARWRVTPNFLLNGQVGYTHGEYDNVIFDLTGDRIVDQRDLDLELTRLAPWSFGISAIYDLDLGTAGDLSARVSYSHRDQVFISDNNLVTLPEIDMIDASLSFTPASLPFTVALYGRNLLNNLTYNSALLLPDAAPFGGDGPAGPRPAPTSQPINRGRVIGVELRFVL